MKSHMRRGVRRIRQLAGLAGGAASARASSSSCVVESLECRKLMSADLTVTGLSITEVSAAAGAEIHTQFTYSNLGDAFEGEWNIELRLTSDEVWGNADDVVLSVEREREDLSGGQSSNEHESVDVPAGTAPGAYRLGIFIDSSGEIGENSEANNVAFSTDTIQITNGGGGGGGGGAVDLTLRGVTANPAPRPVGEDVQVAWTIVNAGGSFEGAFDQEVRLSTDTVWGNADDIVLGVQRESEDFAAGQTSDEDEGFVIPAGTAQGAYYVGVRIDSGGEITESDETNNIVFSPDAVVTVGPDEPGEDRNYSISGNGHHINDDDHSPGRDDATAMGRVRVDGRFGESEFEIHNFGSTELEIERVEIEGRNRRDFAIAVAPRAKLAPGESTTVVVRFDPSKGGVRNAKLVIDTSRDTTNAYEFKLKGNGVVPTDAPDAVVLGRRGNEIRDDDLSPGGGDGTRFRTLALGASQDRTFTLRNDGPQTLLLTTPLLRLTGAGAPAFSIITMPAASLAPGATTTFTMRFAPVALGKQAATIEILSNDPDEAVFNFRIAGRGR